jgi:hypothetical protein
MHFRLASSYLERLDLVVKITGTYGIIGIQWYQQCCVLYFLHETKSLFQPLGTTLNYLLDA